MVRFLLVQMTHRDKITESWRETHGINSGNEPSSNENIFAKGTSEMHQWLYQGYARKITDRFLDLAQTIPDAAKSLVAEAGYFMKHHRRMQ